eukprot:NODE_412_length_9112_cov_0.674692.p5 type:complete len:166 gc:universal NODE_412_length_9112_cov_0.674692:5984-5487(-)
MIYIVYLYASGTSAENTSSKAQNLEKRGWKDIGTKTKVGLGLAALGSVAGLGWMMHNRSPAQQPMDASTAAFSQAPIDSSTQQLTSVDPNSQQQQLNPIGQQQFPAAAQSVSQQLPTTQAATAVLPQGLPANQNQVQSAQMAPQQAVSAPAQQFQGFPPPPITRK